jgi:hypothetical protein
MAILVGRDAELSVLDESLEHALAGRGRLVLLSSEPGIGKTRLAEELTQRAQRRGFLVTWGRAWEGAGTPSYFLWRQVVRRLAPMNDVERLRRAIVALQAAPVAAGRSSRMCRVGCTSFRHARRARSGS